MNTKIALFAAALAVAGTSGAVLAQAPGYRSYDYNNSYNNNGYNSGFWQGAPEGLTQRIEWLQQRIQQGEADGSLDIREARRAQTELNQLRREADVLQQRLDNLSRQIRWARTNDRYGNGYGYNGAVPLDRYRTEYDASRYYRPEPSYNRPLSENDVVYRGSDGRYYCKRSDGTIGLVVGGVGGAALGTVIAGRDNGLAGALIGGALGALLGQSVDRNSDLRCS